MKRIRSILFACLLAIGLILPMHAFAQEPWTAKGSAIMDATKTMSDEEKRSYNEDAAAIRDRYHVDVALAIVTDDQLKGQEPKNYAEKLYQSGNFGYGDNKSGYMCLYQSESEQLDFFPMGDAVGVIDEIYLEKWGEWVISLRENYGLYGIAYGSMSTIRDGLAEATGIPFEDETDLDGGNPVNGDEVEETLGNESGGHSTGLMDGHGILRYGYDGEKPYWYPVSTENFPFYHDAEASRVVDNAGILTPEEEELLAARIAEVTGEIGKDIVIFTDVSTYGLSEDVYCADFYDFNGYGIGDEYEGFCLLVCMDPDNRCFWTAATGSESMALQTQYNANRLDDALIVWMRQGDYAAGFSEWIENIRGLAKTGLACAPAWYPEDGVIRENYVDPAAPIVYDEGGMLTEEEIQSLTEASEHLKEKYGVNVYFHTTNDMLGYVTEQYLELFTSCMGYEPDSVLISMDSDYSGTKIVHVTTMGEMKNRITEKMRERIRDTAIWGDGVYGELDRAQSLLDSYLKSGRVPRSKVYWGLLSLVGALGGLIYGIFSLESAKSTMKEPKTQKYAYSYVDVPHSVVRRMRETYLYSKIHTVKIKHEETRSSSSSSGRSSSSYHSSYSGSSGRSHSGSGRKF